MAIKREVILIRAWNAPDTRAFTLAMVSNYAKGIGADFSCTDTEKNKYTNAFAIKNYLKKKVASNKGEIYIFMYTHGEPRMASYSGERGLIYTSCLLPPKEEVIDPNRPQISVDEDLRQEEILRTEVSTWDLREILNHAKGRVFCFFTACNGGGLIFPEIGKSITDIKSRPYDFQLKKGVDLLGLTCASNYEPSWNSRFSVINNRRRAWQCRGLVFFFKLALENQGSPWAELVAKWRVSLLVDVATVFPDVRLVEVPCEIKEIGDDEVLSLLFELRRTLLDIELYSVDELLAKGFEHIHVETLTLDGVYTVTTEALYISDLRDLPDAQKRDGLYKIPLPVLLVEEDLLKYQKAKKVIKRKYEIPIKTHSFARCRIKGSYWRKHGVPKFNKDNNILVDMLENITDLGYSR